MLVSRAGRILACRRHGARHHLVRHGRVPAGWTPDMDAALVRMWEAGRRVVETAERLALHPTTAWDRVKALGLRDGPSWRRRLAAMETVEAVRAAEAAAWAARIAEMAEEAAERRASGAVPHWRR
jgi:hypothetical protein